MKSAAQYELCSCSGRFSDTLPQVFCATLYSIVIALKGQE